MALDLDVDDGPSFHELVQSGRSDVLKGRTMAQCWPELADQHPFFKDIAKEGRLRGTTLGTVLAAVESISRVVKRTEAANAGQASASPAASPSLPRSEQPEASGCDPHGEVLNAEVLVRVADAYLRLYRLTPVPTRVQWIEALQPAVVQGGVSSATHGDCRSSTDPAASSSTSALGRYVGKVRATVDAVAQELAENDDVEGEDGSFAEEELKECVRCCMAAGRRAARHAAVTKAEGKAVREMVKALQDYVGSSTLEW